MSDLKLNVYFDGDLKSNVYFDGRSKIEHAFRWRSKIERALEIWNVDLSLKLLKFNVGLVFNIDFKSNVWLEMKF